jgi:hypothetical protein
MKNVTISMDDALARRIRVAAAHAGQSVSRYLAEAGQRRIEQDERPLLDEAKRKRQMEALERVLSGPKWDVTIDGRMPTADERNARR